MKKIFKKIYSILISKLINKYRFKNKKWYKERFEICKQCPLNSMNNQTKDFKYWVWKILNLGEAFCTYCGCEIRAKISEEMEECPKNKWQQI